MKSSDLSGIDANTWTVGELQKIQAQREGKDYDHALKKKMTDEEVLKTIGHYAHHMSLDLSHIYDMMITYEHGHMDDDDKPIESKMDEIKVSILPSFMAAILHIANAMKVNLAGVYIDDIIMQLKDEEREEEREKGKSK